MLLDNNKNLLNNKIFAIYGATASGKSTFAIKLAKKIDALIINGDSVQIYKDAPILSNLPSQEEQNLIPHKMFSFLNLDSNFSVGKWLNLVNINLNEALSNNKKIIVVGGTGLYISALIDGISNIPYDDNCKQETINLFNKIGYKAFYQKVSYIDPEFCQKFKDPQRLMRAYEVYLISNKKLSQWQKEKKEKITNLEITKIFINPDKNILHENINHRTNNMLKNGAIFEVQNILKNYNNPLLLKKVLGATEIFSYLNKEITLQELEQLIITKTNQYAKRQNTWFKNKIISNISIKDSNK